MVVDNIELMAYKRFYWLEEISSMLLPAIAFSITIVPCQLHS